jgi:hypothetical protein
MVSTEGQVRNWDSPQAILQRGPVRTASFSNDRKTLLTRLNGGKVRRWNSATGAAVSEPLLLSFGIIFGLFIGATVGIICLLVLRRIRNRRDRS